MTYKRDSQVTQQWLEYIEGHLTSPDGYTLREIVAVVQRKENRVAPSRTQVCSILRRSEKFTYDVRLRRWYPTLPICYDCTNPIIERLPKERQAT